MHFNAILTQFCQVAIKDRRQPNWRATIGTRFKVPNIFYEPSTGKREKRYTMYNDYKQ
jgi:hypothetical protein